MYDAEIITHKPKKIFIKPKLVDTASLTSKTIITTELQAIEIGNSDNRTIMPDSTTYTSPHVNIIFNFRVTACVTCYFLTMVCKTTRSRTECFCVSDNEPCHDVHVPTCSTSRKICRTHKTKREADRAQVHAHTLITRGRKHIFVSPHA